MVRDVVAGRYELAELVGSGGMSSVYRAHDRVLERTVALKVLHRQLADDDEYVERFRREAQMVAGLVHHNIVTVIDRGADDGRPFIVFEYVGGENLKQLVEREGPLPVERALELAIQIAHGLAFAHQNGYIHRDVKPQNVLLNGNGEAKVTDFGIARSLDVQRGVTQTGAVLGTSEYIAPEQAQGQHVDERTDVYSLGILLYELLTAELPFSGDNFVAVAMQHINEPPPWVSEWRPDAPPRVDAAVARALAKRPEDRFATMADFGRELEACLNEARLGAGASETMVLSRPRIRRARRRPSVSALLVVVGLAIAGAALAFALVRETGSSGGRRRGHACLAERCRCVRSATGRRPGTQRRRGEGGRRRLADILGDRGLPLDVRRVGQDRRRARARPRRRRSRTASSHDRDDGHPGLHRRDRGRRQPRRSVPRGVQPADREQ
jgi:tRNA A-37 threonylcarbamoyl transferase component Bud32